MQTFKTVLNYIRIPYKLICGFFVVDTIDESPPIIVFMGILAALVMLFFTLSLVTIVILIVTIPQSLIIPAIWYWCLLWVERT